MNYESVPPTQSPEEPPLAPYDPPQPAPESVESVSFRGAHCA
jgi:hypothetical protein